MTAARPNASLMPSTGPSDVEAEVAPLLECLGRVATANEGDPLALLQLLRQLEQLHRTIQEGPFRSSLPSERSSLFRLLQNMEQSGGWPYIPRLQLRTFLDLLQADNLQGHPDNLQGHPDSPTENPSESHPYSPSESPSDSPTESHPYSPSESPSESPTESHPYSPSESPSESPSDDLPEGFSEEISGLATEVQEAA